MQHFPSKVKILELYADGLAEAQPGAVHEHEEQLVPGVVQCSDHAQDLLPAQHNGEFVLPSWVFQLKPSLEHPLVVELQRGTDEIPKKGEQALHCAEQGGDP